MNLQHIYNLCTQLQSVTSTKAKQQFLIDNRCEDFDFFLKWLLNPQIITGIDKKRLKKKVSAVRGFLASFDVCLNYLKENNTGRDIDIAYCQGFIAANADYADFLTSVFTKSLKLGVDVKLVNKAFGKGFIPVHEVMLGSSRDKLRLKDGEWFSLSQKLNGIRATYVQGKMISRQGKEIKGLDHIIIPLKWVNNDIEEDMVYDGELIRKNVDSIPDNDNFRLTTSIVNAEGNDKSELEFVIFDCLPYKEFINGESKLKYKDRRMELECAVAYIDTDAREDIRAVPIFYQGTDQSEIDKQLTITDELGYEGLMLNKDSVYECKRTTNLIKIKSFKHSDLRIVDVVEGEGKYVGVLGAIIVDYKGNKVNVGSGFTDEQRKEYWAIKEELIGKIAQIKYKEVSKNKDTGLESLQFPVFEMLREKDEVSYE